jgi:hypothetical protein
MLARKCSNRRVFQHLQSVSYTELLVSQAFPFPCIQERTEWFRN